MGRHLLLAVLHGPVQVLELVHELPALLYVVRLEKSGQAGRQLLHDGLQSLDYEHGLLGCGVIDLLLQLENLKHELGVLNFGLVVDVYALELHLH